MIETFVMYVRTQTSVNVFRIDASRDDERHHHRRQRAEHEEEDHERAERADHRLDQYSGAPAASVRTRFLERVMPRHLDGRAGREPFRGSCSHALRRHSSY